MDSSTGESAATYKASSFATFGISVFQIKNVQLIVQIFTGNPMQLVIILVSGVTHINKNHKVPHSGRIYILINNGQESQWQISIANRVSLGGIGLRKNHNRKGYSQVQ